MDYISVTDLKTQYMTQIGIVHAVDGISFFLEKGESIGIAGESACGKSTLGLSIMRSLQGGKVVSGDILFEGKSIIKISESEFTKKYRWKEIAMIFQGAMNSLDPVFTIEQQLHEILKQHNYTGDFNAKASETLISVGLNNSVLKKFPHELSGGMKQRIVIAMALLLNPKFVIADEPTTALDVLVQAQIINLLKKLKKDGMSIMLITHDLAIISEIAEKIGVMYGGKMVEFGNSSEIYKNPKHPYTQGLLESIPSLKENKKPKFIRGNPPSLINPSEGCGFYERCPHAMEKCKKEPPKIKTDSGYVLCWLYE
jgi:peptide/nickel transport system ATP-binding protein